MMGTESAEYWGKNWKFADKNGMMLKSDDLSLSLRQERDHNYFRRRIYS